MADATRTYEIGGGWGMHVEWFTAHEKVWGHHPRRPKVGDLIRSKMQSGRIGVYEVTAVQLEHDPDDMFFADVKALGYEDELAEGDG